jgi:predicted transcriptional regulator of viral defense system
MTRLIESLLVIALAAHYVDYVVTESALFTGVRTLLAKHIPKLGEMVSCYHCMAFWSALFIWGMWQWWPGTVFVVACAVATVVQFLMQARWRTEP